MVHKKIAFYMRSSMEQDVLTRNVKNPDESDTIANQRGLLYHVATVKGFSKKDIVEYVDDGYTGTNFNRPGFQQLLSDIEADKIEAVLVKDFSRMGRDYIGVGEYVEQYFPVKGVRIISVGDDWDSNEHEGETMELDTTFRTMLYDMYSRDLSIKRKSANKARNELGINTPNLAPFGYKKDEKNKRQLIVDEIHAPVVKRIFEMYLSGMKIGDIAKTLTEEKIPTPAAVKNEVHNYDTMANNLEVWTVATIGKILKNEMYTGTLILNRFRIKEFRSDISVMNPEEEWIKFPDNHEPIISKEDFQKVQRRCSKRPKGNCMAKGNVMPIYCGHCGMKFSKTTRNEGTFICKQGNRIPADACGQIQIREAVLKKILIKAVKQQAMILVEDAKKLGKENRKNKEKEELVKRLKEEKEQFRQERMGLYQQFKNGKLEKDVFLIKKAAVLKLEEECLVELEETEKQLEEFGKISDNTKEHAGLFQQYSDMEEFDYNVINQLISKVEVFNDGHIKIIWNYQNEFEAGASAETIVSNVLMRKAAMYTSDMYQMPGENDSEVAKAVITAYARTKLQIEEQEIIGYYDQSEEEKLFFREDYMKFINTGREGRVDYLLIRSFKDLYLSEQDIRNLIYWILPKIPCRLISIEDHFDSWDTNEEEQKQLYMKYRGCRKGDLIKVAKVEKSLGIRERKAPKPRTSCTLLYGYYSDGNGCYADEEILKVIQKIFQMNYENKRSLETVRWLNRENIITPWEFAAKHGAKTNDKKKMWYAEKLSNVTRQIGYVEMCPHYDECVKSGRVCERRPIVTREVFDDVQIHCPPRKRNKNNSENKEVSGSSEKSTGLKGNKTDAI